MKYAVIDMGSNSIRLMIAEVISNQLGKVEKHLAMTRLGAGVNETGQLSEASMALSIEALKTFKKQAEEAGAVLIGAFATSAVRDAQNGESFAKEATKASGVEVTIISGAFEAELGYKGVLGGISDALKDQRFLIIDIGGGSTELIVADAHQIYYRHSFNVGTVRMTGKHIFTDPIAVHEDERLKEDVSNILIEGIQSVKLLKPTYAIGIGGTATTFGAMKLEMKVYDRDGLHNAFVSKVALATLVERLKVARVQEKCQMAGLMPKRADVIYAGGVILEHLLNSVELEGFYVSDYDNLEGILVEKEFI